MKCRDIMRRPVQSLDGGAAVRAAAAKMKEANIGLLVICGSHGLPTGVLTDRDIAIRVVAAGLTGDTSCESVMTRDLLSCGADEDLEVVARLMARYRKSRVLVNEEASLVGIISISDLTTASTSLAALTLHDVAVRELLDVSGATGTHRL